MEGFSPLEVDFMAQDALISIIPSFESPPMTFLSGEFGPFEPLTPVEVPLWLAVAFKKNRMCKITPPTWMEKEMLTKILTNEKTNERTFETLPYHYLEVAFEVLDW